MKESLEGIGEYKKLLAKRDELNNQLEILKKDQFAARLKEFAADVESLDIPNETVLNELRKIFGPNVSKNIRKVEVKFKLEGWEKGQMYVNPKNQNESWEGGKKGPKPAWLESQFRPDMDSTEMAFVFKKLKKS